MRGHSSSCAMQVRGETQLVSAGLHWFGALHLNRGSCFFTRNLWNNGGPGVTIFGAKGDAVWYLILDWSSWHVRGMPLERWIWPWRGFITWCQSFRSRCRLLDDKQCRNNRGCTLHHHESCGVDRLGSLIPSTWRARGCGSALFIYVLVLKTCHTVQSVIQMRRFNNKKNNLYTIYIVIYI